MGIRTERQREIAEEMLRRGATGDQRKQLLADIVAYDRLKTGEFQDVPDIPQPAPEAAGGAPTGIVDDGPAFERSARSGNVRTRLDRQQEALSAAAVGSGMREGTGNLTDLAATPFRSEEEREAASLANINQTAEDRVRLIEDARRLGMPEEDITRMIGLGKLVPDLLMGGVAGGFRTRVGRVLGETAAATLGGAAEDGSLTTALASGGVGFGLGTALELPGALRDIVLNPLRAIRREGSTPNQTFREGLEASNNFGLPLTTAEAAEDLSLLRAQTFVPATSPNKEKLLRRRETRALEAWEETITELDPARISAPQVAAGVTDEFGKTVRVLHDNATSNFRRELQAAAGPTGGTLDPQGRVLGGERVVPLNNFVFERASQLEAEEAVPFVGITGREAEAGKQEIVDFLEDRQGKVTIGELQTMLSTLSKAAYGVGDPVADALSANARFNARNQLQALLEDLENYTGPGGEILQKARKQYSDDIARVKAMENSLVAKLAEGTGPFNSSEFGEKLLSMPPEEITRYMRLAERANPAYAKAARARVLETLVKKHIKVSTRGTGQEVRRYLDFSNLGQELVDIPADKLKALLGTQLPDKAVGRAQDGLRTMLKIAKSPDSFQGKGFLQTVEQYAINTASRSPEFVSRLVAGELSPGLLDKLLYTDQGLKTLIRMSQIGSTKGAMTGAAAGIAQLALDSEKEVEEAMERAREERNRQRALSVGTSNAL